MSVGIVMRRDLFQEHKKTHPGLSVEELQRSLIALAPTCSQMLANATMISTINQATDWSYSASAYAGTRYTPNSVESLLTSLGPNFRLAGDAGCFIDPFFSSGMHLALNSGLSAALTIQASRKGQCTEYAAAQWHSKAVSQGYTRFLLVVITAMKQIRQQNDLILADVDEETFDAAFGFLKPGGTTSITIM
jgi:flavine halogenase